MQYFGFLQNPRLATRNYIRPVPFYRHFLWPFAILYGVIVWFRNRLFDFELLRFYQPDVPIICVGNLETGGTGKSPLVMLLVKILLNQGLKVAVLSRGYRRDTRGFVLAANDALPEEIGDEAMQIKQRFPESRVAVCESRVEGTIRLLSAEPEPDVIIMDDGFQHRWLKPSLSILTTSGVFPFWKNFLLPVGTLREAKKEAKRADVLILPTGNEESAKRYFDGNIFGSKLKTGKLVQISGTEMSLEKIDKVFLFSGIENADRFTDTAKLQFEVVWHCVFSDHHNYTLGEFRLLQKKIDSFGAAVNAVLTTEKDAMRLMNVPFLKELKTPVFYLPIEVSITGNEAQKFDQLILDHVRKDK